MRTLLLLSLCALGLTACGATVGDACTVARDCGPGICVNADYAPGGTCSVGCVPGQADACPAGSTCVRGALGNGQAGCLRTCASGAECRSGYVCKVENDSAAPVCVGPAGI